MSITLGLNDDEEVLKNMNALDILIEDTKAQILNWVGEGPDFMISVLEN